MRKLSLIAVLVASFMMLTSTSFARGSKGNPCDSKILGPILNECSPHTVDTDTWRDEKEAELGVGVDLIVYEGKEGQILNKVTGEYRYDVNNEDHKGYVVATSKLADIWSTVKGVFTKDVE